MGFGPDGPPSLRVIHVDLLKDDFLNESLPTVSSLPVQLFLSTSCNLILLNCLAYLLLELTTPNLDPFAQVLQLLLVYVFQLSTNLIIHIGTILVTLYKKNTGLFSNV